MRSSSVTALKLLCVLPIMSLFGCLAPLDKGNHQGRVPQEVARLVEDKWLPTDPVLRKEIDELEGLRTKEYFDPSVLDVFPESRLFRVDVIDWKDVRAYQNVRSKTYALLLIGNLPSYIENDQDAARVLSEQAGRVHEVGAVMKIVRAFAGMTFGGLVFSPSGIDLTEETGGVDEDTQKRDWCLQIAREGESWVVGFTLGEKPPTVLTYGRYTMRISIAEQAEISVQRERTVRVVGVEI